MAQRQPCSLFHSGYSAVCWVNGRFPGTSPRAMVPTDRLLGQGPAASNLIPERLGLTSRSSAQRQENTSSPRTWVMQGNQTATGLKLREVWLEGGNSKLEIFFPRATVFPSSIHPNPPKSTLAFIILSTLSLPSSASFFTAASLAMASSIR